MAARWCRAVVPVVVSASPQPRHANRQVSKLTPIPKASPLQAVGGFARCDRILHRSEFELVLRRGRRRRGAHLGICVLSRVTPEATAQVVRHQRIGLAVSRGCGHSPARARMRRLLRASFRVLRATWPSFDIVVSCGTPWQGARLVDVVEELDGLVRAATRSPLGRR
jgi:ribonuclease P protein component